MNHTICKSNFDKICRICLVTTDNLSVKCFKELLAKLHYSIGIKLEEDVTLPNAFCENCTKNINMMYNFKELCLYAQQILSDIVRNGQKESVNIKSEEINTHNKSSDDQQEQSETDDKCDVRIPTPDIKKSSEDEINSDNQSSPEPADTTETRKAGKSTTVNKANLKCSTCGKTFKTIRNKKKHMLSHIPKEQRLNYCLICDKSYTRMDTFIRHQKKHQNPNAQVKEQCNICGKSVLKVQKHILTVHSENKSYECSKCDKKFFFEIHLRYHIRRVHNGEKTKSNLLCPLCGRTFSDQHYYRSHLDRHAGHKPYKCTECPFESTWKPNLNYHMRTHNVNREKKFCCTYCDKKFDTGNILRSHIRSHTGERPYACKLCDKRYTQRASLRLHMKSHQLERDVKN